jgi:hypothetical protein
MVPGREPFGKEAFVKHFPLHLQALSFALAPIK